MAMPPQLMKKKDLAQGAPNEEPSPTKTPALGLSGAKKANLQAAAKRRMQKG